MRLRYLHISDLHLTGQPKDQEGWPVEQFNQDLVTRSMLEAIEKLVRQEGQAVDLIFISGDLAKRGKPEEYQVVEVFCRRLLEVTDVPAERFFLVPGNHDVDRGEVDERHLKWWYSFDDQDEIAGNLGSPEAFPALMRKFNAFHDFAGRALGRRLYTERDYFFAEAVSIPKDGETVLVNVVGLNSALFAGYDGDDRQKLAFGLPQVDGALRKLDQEARLTIVLFHHPFACFHPTDKVCQNRLMQKADLILTGHLHEPDNLFLRGAAGQAILISAGASFETRESENSFNVVEVDLGSGAGQVQFYKYLPAHHRWKENTDANPDHERGIFPFVIERMARQARERDDAEPVPQPPPSAAAPGPILGRHFVCYSPLDGEAHALKLYDALQGGTTPLPAWLDRRDVQQPGPAWDTQVEEALRGCESLLLVVTPDSTTEHCDCAREWRHALRYKKPIVPLLFQAGTPPPFYLTSRRTVDFTGAFDPAVANLRQHLAWLATPAGVLRALKDRQADAKRDLRQAERAERARILKEIGELDKQIAAQQQVVKDPEQAARRVEESIAAGLERERKPERPVRGEARTRFINPPPAVAPTYFQDRYVELGLLGDWLKDEACRLVTVVGRAGIGKTAMVCLLLKSLESGRLPDLGAPGLNGDPLPVDGIIYLSAVGARRMNLPNLYADLGQLLPDEAARRLDALYKDPQASTTAKMQTLLAAFPHGRVAVLLDNFEELLDPETHALRDAELDEALRALLSAPHHAVKVVLTTRVAPRALLLVEPGRQARLELDRGLESPYAENILRAMDADGTVGLRDAPEALLAEARERTRGYPRALEALYGILSADRHTSLQEALASAEAYLPEEVVEKLVGQAFNRLGPAAQRVMQALAVYDRPVTPAAMDYLLQPYLAGVDSAPLLNRLVAAHFARKEGGRYHLHPVDRAYAFERIPPGEKADRRADWQSAPPVWSRYALLHRGADYFRQARKPRAEWRTLDDLAPQLAEFDLRCAGGEYDTAAEVLLEIDFDYLLLWGHYRLMVGLHERLQGRLSDPTLLQSSVGNLGLAYYSIGQIQKAIVCHEQALASAREAKERQGEGAWLSNLGNCYADLGQTARAIEYYEQALDIDREIGDRRGEGAALVNLGNRYADLGQTARAIEYYEQALDIHREIGYRRGEGNALGNLGNRYAELGQTARAIEYYEQALAIRREIGDRRGEGADLGNLGNSYAELGQTARAIEYYEQALAIRREIGYRLGEAQNLENLAWMLIDEGRYVEAIQHASESVEIGEEIRSPIPGNWSNSALALAHLYAGNLPAARAATEAAHRYDVPQHNHYVLALLGVVAQRQGDRDAAREAFTAAVAQADALLAHTPQYYAALDSKGLALSGLALLSKDPKGLRDLSGLAVKAYRAARAINRDAGIVGRVLRLFDALAVADTEGRLAGVRAAAAGETSEV